jgi:two-component system, LytTR family, response regulator
MSDPIRVLIVDDERLARDGVRTLLEGESDVAVSGECGDGKSAVAAIKRGGIDVVLLDVQMPGMDGFEVLRAVPESQLPVVVFLTAFDQHALKAFDAQALDYVVKPFSDARFRKAMERARTQVQQRRLGRATESLAALVASLRHTPDAGRLAYDVAAPKYLARIPVRSIGKVSYVKVDDITWVGAADYYAELHTTDGKTHLVRETMQSLEERLDPGRFSRVHRSAIVNLEHVSELRTDSAERHFVILRDGTKLPLGRSRRDALESALARR